LIGRLVEARKAEGLTRARLAEAAGLARSATARLETMKAAPQTDALFKVLTPMGCKLAIAPDETGRRFHFGRPGGPEIMKKKFAFLLTDPRLNPDKDRTSFETDKLVCCFRAASGAGNAKTRARN
jgi:transcriptional regulator with XRE-family HTH domain